MTGPLLLCWVKSGATALESLGTFSPQPSCLHAELRNVPRSPVIAQGTKQKPEAKNTNHGTKHLNTSLRKEKETSSFVSIGFLSENALSKGSGFPPLALETAPPLPITHSFSAEVVLDASRCRSVFSKIGG